MNSVAEASVQQNRQALNSSTAPRAKCPTHEQIMAQMAGDTTPHEPNEWVRRADEEAGNPWD